MNDKTISPETMPEENQQYCPACGEEIVQCENCDRVSKV